MEETLRLMLFHFILAGIFTYLLARSLGMSWLVSIFAGIVYMFTPQLIVLPGVGHGSKLFTAAYIPLVILTTRRLLERRTIVDFALFVFSVGMTLLSIHIQMAYYALLAGGMYLVWSCVFDFKKRPLRIPLKVFLFFGGVALGLAFAASVYLPVYEYTPYSIRGSSSSGGLSWEYATNWSFHPLESLTYFIPSFFGFGGQTYWGYMPFTDMPLYWGSAALVLAVCGALVNRNRTVTFFIVLFFFAWIASFGKFFPVLFKPMFEFLPFFDKFRVPVMIQILMVVSVAILSGFGLEKLKEYCGKSDFSRRLLYIIAGIIAAVLVASILYSPLKNMVSSWISMQRPKMPLYAYGQLFAMLFGDLWKTAIFASLTIGAIYLFLRGKFKFTALVSAAILLLVIDLWMVNVKLVHTQPRSTLSSYFQPTPAVDFLKKQAGIFRIFPIDRLRPQNWYGFFGLESIDGYMGVKMKRYQELLDGVGLTNMNVMNMMNTRYLLADKDLSGIPNFELVMDGQQKVFKNVNALPRAWIVHRTVSLPDVADRMAYIKSFDPREEAIVETMVKIPPGEGGSARIVKHTPMEISIHTSTDTQSFLVLSEIYYPPYWKAYIDGEASEIYPTNHLLRGVVIPAGEHQVEFKCQSQIYKVGWILHWIVFILIFITLAVAAIPSVVSYFKDMKD